MTPTSEGPPDWWRDLFSEHTREQLLGVLYEQTKAAIEAEAAASPEERGGGGDPYHAEAGSRLGSTTGIAGPTPNRDVSDELGLRDASSASIPPAAPSEPAPLDVERLKDALRRVYKSRYHEKFAEPLAAEYARLQSTPTPTEPGKDR